MLSLAPDLYSYTQYIPFVFRIFLAGMLIAQVRYDRSFLSLSIASILGILLLLGLFVQPVACVVGLLQIWNIWKRGVGIQEALPVIILAWSLLFLGPGMFSIDLPL